MKRQWRYLAFAVLWAGPAMAAQSAEVMDGETLYEENCATCHADPQDVRTPDRQALSGYNANSIHHALTQGVMQPQGEPLSESQVIALAEYLSGGSYNPTPTASVASCESAMPPLELSLDSNWNGWGNGRGNHRHQGRAGTRISTDNIGQLELAWTFGLENASNARAQPSIVNGVMLMGSPSGTVYALDLESGCAYWTFSAIAEVRAAVTVAFSEELDRHLAVVADLANRVYVLDARTGERLWFDDVDDHQHAVSTGSPVVHQDRVFVPVSSMEVAAAAGPDYHCCTFRGNMAAYDLASGEKQWHTHVMDEPEQVGTNSAGNPVYAPSGAPIWNTPGVDPSRDRVYAGSGQNYSRPTSGTSDSVIAFDMDTGAMEWVYQTTQNDAFTMACTQGAEHPNCPEAGPDLDIGAPVMPVTLTDGREMVIAGTKGGVVFALDPDNDGELLWQTRVGRGSALGGIHWGMSAAGDTLFVPVADRAIPGNAGFERQPGLHAIDMRTGEVLWYHDAPERCEDGQPRCMDIYSAPATATDDLVITGALNGHLYAHDGKSGELVWEYDTAQSYQTVNDVEASGGAIDATGPVISGDYMIVSSGYGGFGQMPGNVVLVYKLNEAKQ